MSMREATSIAFQLTLAMMGRAGEVIDQAIRVEIRKLKADLGPKALRELRRLIDVVAAELKDDAGDP